MGSGCYYLLTEKGKRGDGGLWVWGSQRASQPGQKTGLGLGLHSPAQELQPHPGE